MRDQRILGRELWSYPTGGAPYHAPVVASGIVYAGILPAGSSNGPLYCLDVRTGARIWELPAGSVADWVVADGWVFVLQPDASISVLNAGTGRREGRLTTPGGYVPVLAAGNGVVYAGDQNLVLHALRYADGGHLWSYPLAGSILDNPVIVAGSIYLNGGGAAYAVDVATGRQQWAFTPRSQFGITGVVAGDGAVYVVDESPRLYAVAAGSGHLLWSLTGTIRTFFGTPATAAGLVYLAGGDLYALSAHAGRHAWTFSPHNGSDIYSVTAGARGLVFAGANDHHVYALRA